VSRYDTPLLLERIRPNLWVENDWFARQRGDLHLENYFAVALDAALQLEIVAAPGLSFLVGAGFEWRRFFGYTARVGTPPPLSVLAFENVDRNRVLLRATGEWVVDPEVLRWDRRHLLEGEVRVFLGVETEPAQGWVDLRYQYVKAFGWHDLWVKSHGHLLWGEGTFHDEVSVGDFTRGLFANQFVPTALNLSLEFRFSVSRDAVKVGLFNDLAVFAVRQRDLGTTTVGWADSFGPGIHVLMLDMFQVDTWVGFGFRDGGEFGAAFSMNIQKAF